MFVSSIHIYPVKSTAGMDMTSAQIDYRGFASDRRWMIVDESGRFITGREIPRMVMIKATPVDDGLHFEAPSMSALDVLAPEGGSERIRVTVWNDTVDAARADPRSEAWLSEFLGRPVRLAMMDEVSARAVETGFGASPDDEVGFADAYPFLAISQQSLDGLNARLAAPIPMRRFRPNLVIDGCDAHAEDAWQRIRIGDVAFEALKTCTRCVFTTVDPATGARDPSGEPLRTLKNYRRSERGITFGMNLVARGRGTIRVGDRVEAC